MILDVKNVGKQFSRWYESGLRGEGHQWEAAGTARRQTDNKSYLGVDRGIGTGSIYTEPLLDFVRGVGATEISGLLHTGLIVHLQKPYVPFVGSE